MLRAATCNSLLVRLHRTPRLSSRGVFFEMSARLPDLKNILAMSAISTPVVISTSMLVTAAMVITATKTKPEAHHGRSVIVPRGIIDRRGINDHRSRLHVNWRWRISDDRGGSHDCRCRGDHRRLSHDRCYCYWRGRIYNDRRRRRRGLQGGREDSANGHSCQDLPRGRPPIIAPMIRRSYGCSSS